MGRADELELKFEIEWKFESTYLQGLCFNAFQCNDLFKLHVVAF